MIQRGFNRRARLQRGPPPLQGLPPARDDRHEVEPDLGGGVAGDAGLDDGGGLGEPVGGGARPEGDGPLLQGGEGGERKGPG